MKRREHIAPLYVVFFVFKADLKIVDNLLAVVTFKSLQEFEKFLFKKGEEYYFESEDCYYKIINNVLYKVPKRKGRKA